MSVSIDSRMADAIRFLSADAVQKANSGHPGAPMGMAEMAAALWTRHLRHDPADPAWPDRDRFVLSNGHGSMLLYSLLHLAGYDLPMSEIEAFRQLHSKTPGHPEVGVTPGVETTTGPLGQGLANAVGMALAEKLLAAEFNRDGFEIVNHVTYVFLGDGCLMEGISHEVCSLAGTLRLSKLIVLYDDNGISIDGDVTGWFRDDTPQRFRAYGWNVIAGVDGHDVDAVDSAIASASEQATRPDGKPTLICCRTTIGKGAPNKAGGHDVHGAPLGGEEIDAMRKALGWGHSPFEIPDEVRGAWDARERGSQAHGAWRNLFERYERKFPQAAAEYRRRMAGELPATWSEALPALLRDIVRDASAVATRKASRIALDAMAPLVPEFFGGSADLTGSNLTNFSGSRQAARDEAGNHLSYGVREFGMAAIMNGMALHGGFLPYGGTFLTFSDYSRNALRMAALMKQRVIHVFTHDSIGVGEDGPTHQSVEHVSSLRLIPNLDVWRPADSFETAVAWASGVENRDRPTALALSRQGTPAVATGASRAGEIRRGGYVLKSATDAGADKSVAVIIGTGTETAVALEAQKRLAEEGIGVDVVSMPSTTVFDRQDDEWRSRVLPPDLPAVAVEAGHPDVWRKYVGRRGRVIGIDRYGESAPGEQLYRHFGITADNVAAAVRSIVSSI